MHKTFNLTNESCIWDACSYSYAWLTLTYLFASYHITYTSMHVHMIYARSCCSSKHINLIINLINKSCKTCYSIDSKLKLMKSKLSRLQICIWNKAKQQEHQNPKIWISRHEHTWEYMKYAYACMKQAHASSPRNTVLK